jgi:hypothetical protein
MNFKISIDFIESQSEIETFKDSYFLKVRLASNQELSQGLLEYLAKETNFKDCVKDKIEFCVKNNIKKIEEINLKLKDITEYDSKELDDSNFSARNQMQIFFFDKEAYIKYHVYFKKTIEQLLQEIRDSVVYIGNVY